MNWTDEDDPKPLSPEELNTELSHSDTIGQYKVVRSLGRPGGSGAVYLATLTEWEGDGDGERQVAIKTLLPKHLHDSGYVERFLREIGILERLQHPNIVGILDHGQTHNGHRFFTMPYHEGETLESMLQRGVRFKPKEFIPLIEGICAGAHYAHHAGLVHRDYKPANVFITRAGSPIILDFGVAKDFTRDPGKSTTGIHGTFGHIAPEVLAGGKADQRSDIFGIGTVFYKMLIGAVPQGWPGDLPPEFRHLQIAIQKALHPDPARRYQTAVEFATDLSKATQPYRGSPGPRVFDAGAATTSTVSAAVGGEFSKGEIGSDALILNGHTIFYRHIASISPVSEQDLRRPWQRQLAQYANRTFYFESGWCLAVFLLCVASVVVSPMTGKNIQDELVIGLLSVLLVIPMLAFGWMRLTFAKISGITAQFGFPSIERKLSIGISNGVTYTVKAHDARVAYLRAILKEKAAGALPGLTGYFDLDKGTFKIQDPTDSATLFDAQGVRAVQNLADGKRLVASERFGQDGACLSVYDAGTLKREWRVLLNTSDPPVVLTSLNGGYHQEEGRLVVAAAVGRSIEFVDLKEPAQGLQLSLLLSGSPKPSVTPRWWERGIYPSQEFRAAHIGVGNHTGTVFVHAGIELSRSHLVRWDRYRRPSLVIVNTRNVDSPVERGDGSGVYDALNNRYLTGSALGWVNVWDGSTMKLLRTHRIVTPKPYSYAAEGGDAGSNAVQSMALSIDVKKLAVGTYAGAIHILDAESGQEAMPPLVPAGISYTSGNRVTSVVFFAKGSRLLSGHANGLLRVWDVASGQQIGESFAINEARSTVAQVVIMEHVRQAIATVASEERNVTIHDLDAYYPNPRSTQGGRAHGANQTR